MPSPGAPGDDATLREVIEALAPASGEMTRA